MKELEMFVNKEKHKKLLEIFMMLDEISKENDILSFEYSKGFLMVEIEPKQYYRIRIDE